MAERKAPSIHRLLVSIVIASQAFGPLVVASSVVPVATSGSFPPSFDQQALELPLVAGRGSARVRFVNKLRTYRDAASRLDGTGVNLLLTEMRRAVPVWLRWSILSSVTGMVMIAADDTDAAETLEDRIAALVIEVGDVSPSVQLEHRERGVLDAVRQGQRNRRLIAQGTGLTTDVVADCLERILRKLSNERERLTREAAGVPFEHRPIRDLSLAWYIELRLDVHRIETIGQLLKWSEADLRRIRGMGVGRIKQVKVALWKKGKRILRDAELPPEYDDLDPGGNAYLWLPLGLPVSRWTSDTHVGVWLLALGAIMVLDRMIARREVIRRGVGALRSAA